MFCLQGVAETQPLPYRRTEHPDGDRRVHLQRLRLLQRIGSRLEP